MSFKSDEAGDSDDRRTGSRKPRSAPARLSRNGAHSVWVGGCATVPRAGGFAEVRSPIGERTGRDVRWVQGKPQDEEVRAAVERLLERPLDVDGGRADRSP